MNREIQEQLEIFKRMSLYSKGVAEQLIKMHDKNNSQQTVLLISLVRVIKYFDAYIMLVENGYGEPASDLIRSMYHTLLWMRWSLISKENADIYFNIGGEDMKRMLNKSINMGIINVEGPEDPKKTLEMLCDLTKKTYKPKVQEQAEETGYGDFHNLVYTTLAGISHGSINFLKENNTVSYMPDDENIEPFFAIANNIFIDCTIVAEQYFKQGTIRPVPNILELTGIEKAVIND
ncbi:MAG: hypothetical protein IPM96_04555 [Ignavibacteria bacterium]|nr:hypothetical protein [Ignavibacteria bacterium]